MTLCPLLIFSSTEQLWGTSPSCNQVPTLAMIRGYQLAVPLDLPEGGSPANRGQTAAAPLLESHRITCCSSRDPLPCKAVWVRAGQGRPAPSPSQMQVSSHRGKSWVQVQALLFGYVTLSKLLNFSRSQFSRIIWGRCLPYSPGRIIKRGSGWESTEHNARDLGCTKQVFKRVGGKGEVFTSLEGLSITPSPTASI